MWSSLVAQLVKNQCRRPWFNSWVRKIRWRRDRLPTPVSLGFSGGSAGKEFTCNAGDLGSIPGLGRSPGGGKGSPLQYSGLEISMDCIVRGVTNSWTRLSDFHSLGTVITTRCSNPTPEYPSEVCNNSSLHRNLLMNVCSCFIHNRPILEAIKMSFSM